MIEEEKLEDSDSDNESDFFGSTARRIGRDQPDHGDDDDSDDGPTLQKVDLEKDWRNGVLVLVSTRLGLKKVGIEYFGPVRDFFAQTLNCGIVGGRPKEAYYLVGMQEDCLVFLDPHNTKPTVDYDLNEIKKNHMQFHEQNAKKIHYTKIDPTMTFCFYIRNHSDFAKF